MAVYDILNVYVYRREELLFMKRIALRSLCLIMMIILTLGNFCACFGAQSTVKDGITVEPGAPLAVSDAAKSRGSAVIEKLLLDYYEENKAVPTDGELAEQTDRLLSLSLEIQIGDKKYLDFIDFLEECGGELISALSNPDGDTPETLINAYLGISSLVSSEYSGGLLFGLALFAYDEKYSEYFTKYEATGKANYKVLADGIAAQKEIFVSSVDKSDFSALCELIFFVRGLFVSGALDSGAVGMLLDAEILLILERLDFSELDIEPAGYALLLNYYSDALIKKDETTYFDELLYELNYSGDGARVSERMGELIALLSSVKEALTAEDVGLFRTGELGAALSSVFSRFGDEEYELFERLGSSFEKKSAYDKVANSFFGDDYTEYKSTKAPKTLSELRLSVGTDEFYNTLEGYVFGISPAFSYGMSNDRD